VRLSCFLGVKHVALGSWSRAHVSACLVLRYAWSLLFCMEISRGRCPSTCSKRFISNIWFWESLFCSRNRNPTCGWWTKYLFFTENWTCQPPMPYRIFFSGLKRFGFRKSCLFWRNILWGDIWLGSKIFHRLPWLNLHALLRWFFRVD